MSYRPKVKADSSGTLEDLPLDAETVQGKTPVFTTTNQTIAGDKTYTGNQIITGYLDIRGTAAEKHLKTRGIGGSDGQGTEADLYLQYSSSYSTKFGTSATGSLNSDGTITEAGTLLSNKYAAKSHTHSNYVDLTTSQSISGTKRFIYGVFTGDGSEYSTQYYTDYIERTIYGDDEDTNYTYTLPNKSGTFAMTSDIPSVKAYTTGVITPGGALSISSTSYVYILFPFDSSTSTFSFTISSSSYTGYQFAIAQGGGCIRFFSSSTTLTRTATTSITFSTMMRYIRFTM